jgi:signal transduction histidine kinase
LLDDALRAADRAADLTKHLLAFARRQVVKPRPTSLAKSIDESVSMLRRVLGSTIELRCEVASDLRLVFADPGQLNQIVLNIGLNARDAIAQQGRVDIRAFNRTIEVGELSTQDGPVTPGDYVVLVIEDDGTGIEPELLPRLFEPFVTTKAAGKGTGLGLASCYGIVRQLGGAIRVESELGVAPGSSCCFRARQKPSSSRPPRQLRCPDWSARPSGWSTTTTKFAAWSAGR